AKRAQLHLGGFRLCLRLLTAEMRFDTRYKLARAERLGDVIVAANLETEDTVHLVDPRRQKQNRQAREAPAGSYAAAKLKAVQTGQHHIEHNQIGRVLFDRCEG